MLLNPLNENVERTHDFEQLECDGEIPNALRGTFYKTGPGVFQRFGERVNHAFEADGLLSAVRFTSEGAFGAVKPIESPGYREEENAGRYLFNSNASWWTRMKNAKKGAKTTGNTSLFSYQSRLYALMEAGLLQEIDANTLATLGVEDLGIVPTAFSAHPHRVEKLKTTFNFGVRYGKQMMIDMFALPDTGSPRCIGTIPAPWNGMIHDFMATEKHLIFLIAPVKIVLWRALLGMSDFTKLFRWHGDESAKIVVVPIDNPTRPRTFEIDPLWAWHFAGGYDTNDGIVVDLAAYENFDSLGTIGAEGDSSPPKLKRIRTSGDAVKVELLHDIAIDFPTRHPLTDGSAYRHLYAATLDGLVHLDIETGLEKRWQSPGGLEGTEPFVVPRSERENDAFILAMIYDEERRQSGVSILDGLHLDDGPMATAWFNQPIPLTFHGTFVAH